MRGRQEVERVITESGGLFIVREHPTLERSARRLVGEGGLQVLLPGVFVRWGAGSTADLRLRAAAAWAPNAVVTGRAAARLTFWRELSASRITVSTAHHQRSHAAVHVTRETIPPELVTEVGGIRVTVPALTALDLALDLGGEGIDRALRLRAASLDDMAEALNLTVGRRGNAERRRWLLDSRDEPWSEAEREGHRLLRSARITGWRGNLPVVCGSKLYYLDAGFEQLKIGLEIDGREVHKAENVEQFYTDRRKWTTLNLHGWLLLHFGANHVFDEADWFLDCVGEAVAIRRQAA